PPPPPVYFQAAVCVRNLSLSLGGLHANKIQAVSGPNVNGSQPAIPATGQGAGGGPVVKRTHPAPGPRGDGPGGGP
ncbi:hypothetical protein, partial [Bacillus cereus]|uniref:hypothetical protein n=1 Tax=Bacillus cereus TaxID=1396 RepID=UPI0018F46E75